MKVHIHGNCQSFVLWNMLKEACPDWNVTYYEVHAAPILQNLADYRSLVTTADIVLSQPIHAGYRATEELSLEWIREHVRRDAQLVVIPALHFSGHQPEYCNLGMLGNLCHNALAAHLAMGECRGEQIVDLLLSETLFNGAFIQNEIALQLAEIRMREERDRPDVSVSDIIEAQSGASQLFHIINHPIRALCAHLINRVFLKLGIDRSIEITGRDYMANPRIPLLPAIAKFCEAGSDRVPDWIVADPRVLMPNHFPMTLNEFLEKMIVQLRQNSTDKIMAALKANWRSQQFLERLQRSGADIPGISMWQTV